MEAALAAANVPSEIYTVAGGALVGRCVDAGSTIFEISGPVLEAISTTIEPQDPVGVITIPEQREFEVAPSVVAVGISDPGNLGTLIRTAAALGWQIVLIGGADPWSPKVLRASAGAQLTHPAITMKSLDPLLTAGLKAVATTVSGGIDPRSYKLDQPVALLVGNEAHGLPAAMIERCEALLTIPIAEDVESLNAAVSAAIVMFAVTPAATPE